MEARVSISSRPSTGRGSGVHYLTPESADDTDDSLLAPSQKHSSSYGSFEGMRREGTIISMNEFDQFSVHTICPNCKEEIDTQLRYRNGTATYACFLLLMVLTCGLLAWLAFLVDHFKDIDHVCQHCGDTGAALVAAACSEWERVLMMDVRVSVGSRQSTGSDVEYLIHESCDFTDDSLVGKHHSSYGTVEPIQRSNTIITMSEFDQFSAHTLCPYCKEETDTKLRHHTGSATFKCFLLLVVLTCGLLACLPFLLNDFKDVDHVCQHCGETIATYKRKFISR